MAWGRIVSIMDAQARSGDALEQRLPGPQDQDVRQDRTGSAIPRPQGSDTRLDPSMKRWRTSESGVVDTGFEGRRRAGRKPRRVAHDEVGAYLMGRDRLRPPRRISQPNRSRFSWAQVTARGLMSVATTRSTPRRSSTAASTPVPVPRSKAVWATPPVPMKHQWPVRPREMVSGRPDRRILRGSGRIPRSAGGCRRRGREWTRP